VESHRQGSLVWDIGDPPPHGVEALYGEVEIAEPDDPDRAYPINLSMIVAHRVALNVDVSFETAYKTGHALLAAAAAIADLEERNMDPLGTDSGFEQVVDLTHDEYNLVHTDGGMVYLSDRDHELDEMYSPEQSEELGHALLQAAKAARGEANAASEDGGRAS
jgi:hypothetical protein